MPIKAAKYGWPFLAWLKKDSPYFIGISRSSRRALTRIHLFDSETGEKLDSKILEPIRMIPYDIHIKREKEENLSTRHANLIRAPVYEWSSIDYDMTSKILTLQVYRPSGELGRIQNAKYDILIKYEIKVRIDLEGI